jgi:hypothetical protein
MATILSKAETERMNRAKPTEEAATEIREALDNLKKVIEKHGCTAFIETVCGEISVFRVPKGKTLVVKDRDDKQPPSSDYCRGLYLSTGFQTYNAEHEIVYQV